jgi:hypothetical protein
MVACLDELLTLNNETRIWKYNSSLFFVWSGEGSRSRFFQNGQNLVMDLALAVVHVAGVSCLRAAVNIGKVPSTLLNHRCSCH